MTTNPSFTAAVNLAAATITAANTNLDGSGSLVTVIGPAGANGLRIERVEIKLRGIRGTASSANVVRLWLYDGATATLFREAAFATSTPSGSVAGAIQIITFPNATNLKAGWYLKATVDTYVDGRDSYVVTAFGGDY